MDELIGEFLTETRESLEILDQEIVELEQNPNDKVLLGNIFRVMHTVKGTCGFLGLSRLEKVAHAGENIMGLYRDGVLEVKPDSVTLIFESLDRIKEIIDGLEQTGSEPQGDDSQLISKLDAVVALAEKGEDSKEDVFTPVPASQTGQVTETPDEQESQELAENNQDSETETENLDQPQDQQPQSQAAPKPQPAQESGDDKPKAEVQAAAQTLRVSVDVLEDLMTMVSELVLTRNQLLQTMKTQYKEGEGGEIGASLQNLNHVVSDLQEAVMKTRMQPIGNAWSKLPRIIRDLSQELNKKINLDMRGKETELDRQVLDLIKDPLTHMIRNSADHGIEKTEDRIAAGKPEVGNVILEAFHEGGHIIIRIIDDGKGIPVEILKRKALDKGLITPQEAETMQDGQIQKLIFHPGFSTAEKVTSVSGRGVGMDVVRTNIEKIGGTVDLKSIEGKGTTFIIKIPLTLAIVSALIIESAGEKYAIPQLAVQELVRSGKESDQKVEYIKGVPVLRLRNRLLPLVSLKEMLKLTDSDPSENGAVHQLDLPQEKVTEQNLQSKALSNNDQESDHDKSQEKIVSLEQKRHEDQFNEKYIVVSQVGNTVYGLIVDRIYDTEEIVVKPVSPILRHIELFAGNTILGDGSVIMILDPNGIANAVGNMDVADGLDNSESDESELDADSITSLLLFKSSDNVIKAVPLSLVSRLEEIYTDKIEQSNGRYVVQYRGQLMPLVLFDENMSWKDQKSKPVLVFSDHLRSMGLVVNEIIDIVEQNIVIDTSTGGNGVMGGSIVNGVTTDIIDVGYYLNKGHKDWFAIDETTDPFEKDISKRVLFVDDSPFFRNMLVPLLTVAGYKVKAVESAAEAIKVLESGTRFDLIVSDIEMPDMNGFEFVEAVRSSTENWKDLPMVALSSHATSEDKERGSQAGFTDYVPKFDKSTILDTLQNILHNTQNKEDKTKGAAL